MSVRFGVRPAARRAPLALIVVAAAWALGSAGCASTSSSFEEGVRAERFRDYDAAVSFYARAVAENPEDGRARLALAQAKLRAARGHAAAAERHAAAADWRAAEDALRTAVLFAPEDAAYAERLAEVRLALEEQREATRAESLAALKQEAMKRPLGLATLDEARAPADFVFRDAGLRDVFLTLGELAGVNILFDEAFRDQAVSIEADGSTFDEVLRGLCATTGNFFRVESPRMVTIVPDTPEKREQYEQRVAQTFYLSTADLVQTTDAIRIVLGAQQIAAHEGTNSITIVDTWEQVRSAARIVQALDRGPGEVVVDVELMEVNRSLLQHYGLPILTPGLESRAIETVVSPLNQTLTENPYDPDNLGVTGLPSAVLDLLREDRETHVLANPQLRASDGRTATANFGEQTPVPVTTFAPIATGGIAQQPTTTYEYRNVGVSIEVLPRIHHDDSVTLDLKMRLDNEAGAGFGGLPSFGNRDVETTLRLRNGETSMIAGLIREEERTRLNGIPGVADVPLLGRLFGRTREQTLDSDIILTLTPRIVRRAELTREDLLPHVVEGKPRAPGGVPRR